jgi:hypothetical protein
LYDSGTTCHISPYRDQFTVYEDIPPKSLNAANQQKFVAVGKGDIVIELPNGVDTSKVTLTEVLFSPEVGYTLVSIGRLDQMGYSSTFGDSRCTIHNAGGDEVGNIPRSKKGIYKVTHDDEDIANSAETVTYIDFHKRMGHISPGIAKLLAEKGMVTGI